jgi:hypothetical protein
MALVQPQQQGFDNSRLYMWVKGLESKVNNLIREVDVIKKLNVVKIKYNKKWI